MHRTIQLRNVLTLALIALSYGFGCGGTGNKSDRPTKTYTISGEAGGGADASGGSGGSKTSTTAAGGTAGASSTSVVHVDITPDWDYNGIVGTGQSLSVGAAPITSTTQPFHNLMLDLGTAVVPPWDSSVAGLSLVPLIEVSNFSGFPSPYPHNRGGETLHSSLANTLTSLVQSASGSDYASVHTIVGESGQGMVALAKQTGDTTLDIGRAYAATLFEAEAITRLAKAAGKTYGIRAIVMTHGETDSGSPTYESELLQLLSDYNKDLPAITGQTKKIPMLISQQFAYPNVVAQKPVATQLQWRLSVEHPDDFICTGPKYQYPGKGDSIHLSAEGYKMLGEKIAQVYYERLVLGKNWRPLEPESVTRSGRVFTVKFHVPVGPLNWDESFTAPTAWVNGKGFELRRINSKYAIESVKIAGDSVEITAASDLPADNITIGYAVTASATPMETASRSMRWGQLRDSDPFVGYATGKAQPNYAVAFEIPVP